jgi:hypothetical protein
MLHDKYWQSLVAIVLTHAILLFSTRAVAGDAAEKARAIGLAAEAQALAEAGQHDAACAKFQESVALHRDVENQYRLADCLETIGRTASAYAAFREIIEMNGEVAAEKTATERADALATKLTRLRVDIREEIEGLEVTQNGKPIAKKDWGKPIPVDPGKVEVRATAPGRESWHESLTLPADPVIVLVMVPPLANEKKKAIVATSPSTEKTDQTPDHAEENSSVSFRSVATIGLLGIGATGVIVGSIMGVHYATTNSDAKDVCPLSVACSEREIALHSELVNDARTARTWSYVGFAVGAAGLAGAAVLHFTAPAKNEHAKAPSLGARVFVTRDGTVTGALRGEF